MTSMLDDTVKTTKKVLDETRDNAVQVAGRTRSTLLDGLHAAASAMTMIRGLGLGDALGWIGLERRRGPIGPILGFGAGFLSGAAAGVLFAPMAGVETRRWLAERAMGVERQAEQKVSEVQTKVADKAGELADQAKSAVHQVEDKMGAMADQAKHTASDLADQVKHTASDLADQTKHTAHQAEDRLAQGAAAVKDGVKGAFDDDLGRPNGNNGPTKAREIGKPLTPAGSHRTS